MTQVFISYSRQDSKIVDKFSKTMEVQNIQTWLDRKGIQGGDQWRRQIVTAIENSDIFVITLSPNSVNSDNVRKELDLAESAGVPIIPVKIAPVKIPKEMKYQLAGLQVISLDVDFDHGMIDLRNAILKKTKKPKKEHKQNTTPNSSTSREPVDRRDKTKALWRLGATLLSTGTILVSSFQSGRVDPYLMLICTMVFVIIGFDYLRKQRSKRAIVFLSALGLIFSEVGPFQFVIYDMDLKFLVPLINVYVSIAILLAIVFVIIDVVKDR